MVPTQSAHHTNIFFVLCMPRMNIANDYCFILQVLKQLHKMLLSHKYDTQNSFHGDGVFSYDTGTCFILFCSGWMVSHRISFTRKTCLDRAALWEDWKCHSTQLSNIMWLVGSNSATMAHDCNDLPAGTEPHEWPHWQAHLCFLSPLDMLVVAQAFRNID